MGALTHALGKECDWLIIVFIRMLLSFIFTVALALRSRVNPFVMDRPLLWFRSLVGSSAMIAMFYALTNLPISDVAVITETRPIWVALIAGYILGEYTGRRVWVSILCGFIGVALVEHPHLLNQNFAGFVALYGAFAGAIVMICLRALRDLDPRVIVTHFSATASVVALVALLSTRDTVDTAIFHNPKIVIMLLGIGLFGTIGQLTMTKAFSMGEAPSVASAGFMRVGFAAFYDVLIWKHVFSVPTVLGIALILGSITWLFSKEKSPQAQEMLEDKPCIENKLE